MSPKVPKSKCFFFGNIKIKLHTAPVLWPNEEVDKDQAIPFCHDLRAHISRLSWSDDHSFNKAHSQLNSPEACQIPFQQRNKNGPFLSSYKSASSGFVHHPVLHFCRCVRTIGMPRRVDTSKRQMLQSEGIAKTSRCSNFQLVNNFNNPNNLQGFTWPAAEAYCRRLAVQDGNHDGHLVSIHSGAENSMIASGLLN